MVGRKTGKEAKAGEAYRSSRSAAGYEVDKLTERAPRLARLAKSISGDRKEISEEQRAFLKDFAAEVGKGAEGEGEDS